MIYYPASEQRIPKKLMKLQSQTHESHQNTPKKTKGIYIIAKSLKNSSVLQKQCYDPLLKAKWEKIMRYPFNKIDIRQVEKMIGEGPMMEERLWIWMIGNRQKISSKLYSLRKQQAQSLSNRTENNPQNQQTKGNFYFWASSTLNIIIKTFLIQRPDFVNNSTIHNICATFYYYTNGNQLKTFALMNYACTTDFFRNILSRQSNFVWKMARVIVANIHRNCGIYTQIKQHKIILEGFIELWLQSFFYTICQNGWSLKEKIITYLLLYKFSFEAISKVCEATTISIARMIKKNKFEQIISILTNPKQAISEKVFMEYLLSDSQF